MDEYKYNGDWETFDKWDKVKSVNYVLMCKDAAVYVIGAGSSAPSVTVSEPGQSITLIGGSSPYFKVIFGSDRYANFNVRGIGDYLLKVDKKMKDLAIPCLLKIKTYGNITNIAEIVECIKCNYENVYSALFKTEKLPNPSIKDSLYWFIGGAIYLGGYKLVSLNWIDKNRANLVVLGTLYRIHYIITPAEAARFFEDVKNKYPSESLIWHIITGLNATFNVEFK